MLETAQKSVAKVKDISRQEYDEDENLRLALTHLIQIIGEAAGRVSEETLIALPEVPWREIIGMRHRIVHDYLNIDEDIVWQVVTEDLPPLINHLRRIVLPED